MAALLVWFAAVIPSQTCGGPQPRGSSAFLAYQLARTTADIEAVFGQQGDPCRAAMVAALNLANKVDLVAFIAVYSAFFASFFLALLRSGNPGIARVGFVAVVFTLLCDVLETSVQLYITSSLPGSASSLVLLTLGNTGKFLGLTVVGVCAGAAMLARGGLLGRLAGVVCLVGGLTIVVGLNYSPAQPALPIGIALIGLMILIYAALAAVRRTGGAIAMALALVAVTLLVPPLVWAADDSETELAKKTQNPVADLISVPFQNNFYFNSGTKDATVYALNVQPVIPLHLTEDWNLITRTIMPIIHQPSLFPGTESAFGMGDLNPTLFLSPAKPGRLIWGFGPTFTFPTATDSQLGAGKYSMGPAAVGLFMEGPWVVGGLVNNQWSFAGWGHKDVNQMTLQPFVNYNFSHGWYVTSSPILTGNWTARASDQWTVPVGGGVGRLFRIGPLPINTQLQAFYNADRPKDAANWQLRFQFEFLFPR